MNSPGISINGREVPWVGNCWCLEVGRLSLIVRQDDTDASWMVTESHYGESFLIESGYGDSPQKAADSAAACVRELANVLLEAVGKGDEK